MDQSQTSPSEIPFQQVIQAVLDADTPLNPRFLYRLSDLEGQELEQMRSIWPQIVLWRRQALLEDIEELSEKDSLLSFEGLGRLAIDDEDPKVRQLAIETLADYEGAHLAPLFITRLKDDPAPLVRAAAAAGLGAFVYAGEIEQIPARLLHEIEHLLLQKLRSDDAAEVRRAALESLGFSSRDEMPVLIQKAFASEDRLWKASALLAMGRSATPQWEPQVMSMLESSFPILRTEAARAAGELELHDATPILLEMLDDPEPNARQAAIWSLSQLGGEGVRPVLERLFEEADETELDFLEEALENLAFNEGVQMMPMFDPPKVGQEQVEDHDDEEDWYEEVDLEDMDEDELDEYEEGYDDYDEEDEDLAD
jgi:hypothetical protein